MEQGLSGGTTNLLRMARSGCQSGSSFVALAVTDDSFATAGYPTTPEPGAVDVSTIDAVVRQLWHDPGLGRGKALVRTVRIGEDRLSVAAVPLAMNDQGRPSGILGVVDPGGKAFGLPDLELLARIGQRLTSYVQARRTVRSQLADARPDTAAERPVAGDRPTLSARTWWGEPDVGPPAGAGLLGTTMPPGFPLPPFPPPAGTAGVSHRTVTPDEVTRPATGAPEPWAAGYVASEPPASGPASPEPRIAAQVAGPSVSVQETPAQEDDDAVRSLLGGADTEIEGLVPLGTLLGRAGRLLGAGNAMGGSLAVVAIDVESAADASTDEVTGVARALRTELRFDDPLARIGALSFVAVVPLAPGASTAAQVEAHLARQVRGAVARRPGARVHAAHVVAPLNSGQDADELLRAAVVKLRAR